MEFLERVNMNQELSKEVLTRLDAIAAKLGVAAGEVWRILLKQAFVESVVQVVVGVLLAITAAIVVKWFYSRVLADQAFNANIKEEHSYDYYRAKRDPAGWVTGMVLCSIAGLVAIGVAISGILGVMNPEYYALRELLSVLK
jgi:uncharacterized membrane protein YraQ (UPF0718 family)